MGSNFTKACYLNVTPVHSIQGIIIFKKPLLQLLASICWNDIIKKFIWLNWVQFIKWVNFSKFSKFNIFVIFEDRASFIIAGKQELRFYLLKKCISNDLKFQYQGQMALYQTWHYFCKKGYSTPSITLKTSRMTHRLSPG